MKNNSRFEIKYFPIRIHLICKQTVELPYYLGTMLHGVIGWMLTQNKSLYQFFYENRRMGSKKQDIVNPYIINPPKHKAVYYIVQR